MARMGQTELADHPILNATDLKRAKLYARASGVSSRLASMVAGRVSESGL